MYRPVKVLLLDICYIYSFFFSFVIFLQLKFLNIIISINIFTYIERAVNFNVFVDFVEIIFICDLKKTHILNLLLHW